MLANPGAQLGFLDFLALIGQYLASALSFAFNTLGTIVDIPLKLLSEGVDIAFNGLAGVLENIPYVGPILAQIVLLGGAVLRFALSIPGFILHELGNLLEGAAKALEAYRTPEEREADMKEQKDKVVEDAPPDIKDNVKALLDATAPNPKNLSGDIRDERIEAGDTPDPTDTTSTGDVPPAAGEGPSFVEKVLPVAIPVTAAGLFLALVFK